MFHKPYQTALCALALSLTASPAFAAHFFLPDDAVLDVREFAFPTTIDTDPNRNLTAEFHEQLVLALQKVGFTVLDAQEETRKIPAPPPEPSAPLTVTPLNEMPGDDPATSDFLAENEDTEGEDAENGEGGDGTPDARGSAEGSGPEEPESVPPSMSLSAIATHVLEGRVTLFRETVGNPTRVGSSIRIRTEALLHCTYTLKDATTDKVLLSDVSSGSSAQVTSQTQEIDDALSPLSRRAMSSAAAKIAAHLSGTDVPASGPSDRDYYQDSPGKRLKPQQ